MRLFDGKYLVETACGIQIFMTFVHMGSKENKSQLVRQGDGAE